MKAYIDFAIIIVFFTGTITFYCLYEGWHILDSAVFVTATITTVGFGYNVPSDDASRGFTIFTMIFGILAVFSSFTVK